MPQFAPLPPDRRSRFLVLALALVLGVMAQFTARPVAAAPEPLGGPPGPWVFQEAYSDEFEGGSVDRGKWDNQVKSWGTWSWAPDNTFLEDGKLHIRMRYDPHDRDGKRIFYKSGILQTKAPPIRYGFFEARLKAAPLSPGVAAAFWSHRAERDKITEIDFVELMETLQGRKVMQMTHTFKYPGMNLPKQLSTGLHENDPFDYRKDFHVYGCAWDEREIIWYVDGKEWSREANTRFDQPLNIILSMGLRRPYTERPSPEGFPTVMEVDYVRVWQRP
jgi:beta-glucanase (GH16 family)